MGRAALEADSKLDGIIAEALQVPSPWPNANARLLGLGLGLPVPPLDRLKNFSDKEFERFTLECPAGSKVRGEDGEQVLVERKTSKAGGSEDACFAKSR